MTSLLASVTDVAEAQAVLAGGADIIDLKQPESGALGALSLPEIEQIVASIAGRCPISATIGDLPADPEAIAVMVRGTAATKVDIVKVGLFGCGNWEPCIHAASAAAPATHLVAVFFADQDPNLDLIGVVAGAGFYGAMLDTAEKGSGGLLRHIDRRHLAGFIHRCRSLGLACGLAGSLSATDIPSLLPLGPDYLGFRSALCADSCRTARIDPRAVRRIRRLLPQPPAWSPLPRRSTTEHPPVG